MTQEELNAIHANLFMDPEQIYLSVEEKKIYYIDDDDNFRTYNVTTAIEVLTYEDCFRLIGKPLQ